MANPKPAINVYAVAVSLPASTAASIAALVPEGTSVPEKLGLLATQVLTDLGNGGMLVDPQTMAQLGEIAHIGAGPDLVPLVEKAMRRQGGGIVVSARLDPVWLPAIKAKAELSDVTPGQLVQWLFDQMIAKNLIMALPLDPPAFMIERSDIEEIREILGIEPGETLTGTDIAEFIKRQAVGLPTGV